MTEQFKEEISWRTDKRLNGKRGTCNTLVNVSEGVTETDPTPAIVVVEPSAKVTHDDLARD